MIAFCIKLIALKLPIDDSTELHENGNPTQMGTILNKTSREEQIGEKVSSSMYLAFQVFSNYPVDLLIPDLETMYRDPTYTGDIANAINDTQSEIARRLLAR